MRKLLWTLPLLALPLLYSAIDELTILPMDDPAIRYTDGPVHNRVTALQERLAKGKVPLTHHPEFGYLTSILKALDVPVSSQVLVFSKTSFQAHRIGPQMPRAIYHSDDISVGYVRGGDVLEIAAVDPKQGVVFYTFDQWETEKPGFVRRGECFMCHVGAATLGVPGLVVRSVHAERTGIALLGAPAYISDHRSPLNRRWGGWYVTGTHGAQQHMGNNIVDDKDDPSLDLAKGANITDLHRFFNQSAYLEPTSDIVSLMVLEHQTRMTNLITRLGWETRLNLDAARLDATAAELVSYMLFVDEAKLTEPIKGSDNFAADFVARGPKDKQGRSLRELDMKTRMFRYPCSFLIYSEQFDALPQSAKDRVYRRLYDSLTAGKQTAILEILRDTKKDLPDYWK